MKGILVILDGLGDLSNKQLNDKTPLEAADIPNLNFLATRGELGIMYSVKQGFVPESDEAIVSIFGNKQIDSTRGQLEARGADLKLVRGDLALRANFATIDSLEEGNIIDRRAGRTLTTEEAEALAKSLNRPIADLINKIIPKKIKIGCGTNLVPNIRINPAIKSTAPKILTSIFFKPDIYLKSMRL